jgi:L-aminopeptidase/D-esterase-like protein
VPGAVIFDLTVGSHAVRPDAAMGYRACASAGLDVPQGNVGAGTGAGIGGDHGPATAARMMKGGLGTASETLGDLVVGALVVVNCFGRVQDPATGEVLAGLLNEGRDCLLAPDQLLATLPAPARAFSSSTTIGVVAVNARMDKARARRVAMMGHDGYARVIDPIHTMQDGDTVFCVADGTASAPLDVIGALAARAMSRAVVNAVRAAATVYGLPCAREMKGRR